MKKFALCIGNDDYRILTHLNCAVADATAVGKKLELLKFDTIIKHNLDRENLNIAITDLYDKINYYDVLFFYYAGHGMQVDGKNLLIPTDFNDKIDKNTYIFNAYPLNCLMEMLDKSDVKKVKIIVLDACRTESNIRGGGYAFAPLYAPQGSIIAFSTSPGQFAKEGDGHGFYTKHLLEYMETPRISIETMFKRVRTALANETNNRQISWEHTSLIGDFQLNRNTIYSGSFYTKDAQSDKVYTFARDSQVKSIVEHLKSYTWDTQNNAVKNVFDLTFKYTTSDDLFVLGRNIYQAACGGSFGAKNFIDDFTKFAIPPEAKTHILNGMAFEIYFNSEGKYRRELKSAYSPEVIRLLETDNFFESRKFIISVLEEAQENSQGLLFYMPGQSEKIKVRVILEQLNDKFWVKDIIANGQSIYFDRITNEQPQVGEYGKKVNKPEFEASLRRKMAVMEGYLKFDYGEFEVSDRNSFLIPWGDFCVLTRNS